MACRQTGVARLTLDGTGELRLAGRLDVASAADARLALRAAVDRAAVAAVPGPRELRLRLGDLEVADATGLGVLVEAHRHAGRRGVALVLHDVPPRLCRMLVITRLHRVLHIAEPCH
jgi:anti-anti-sigma factor